MTDTSTRDDHDRRLANMRLAACVNLVLLSMEHGERKEFTDRDAQALRLLTRVADDAVANGVGGIVPSGFGIVQSHQSAALEAVVRALETPEQTRKTIVNPIAPTPEE